MDINELESFELADAVKFHDKLNPALWDEGNRMRPEVREALLKIAQDFQEFMGIGDFALEDITVSGSNAAYSYTPHSDIDLHLIVDQSKLNPSEVYKELFNAKKYQYNDQHDIKIKGYDVELYVQNAAQPHESLGVYSLVKDDWNRIPTARRSNLDEPTTRVKYEKLGHVIEQALRSSDYDYVNRVLDTVKKYRKAGLDEKGEFGPENLAFKALRKSGLVQKLWDHRADLKDQQLSLREKVAHPRKSWGKFNGMQFEGEEIAVNDAVVDVEKTVEKFVRYVVKYLKLTSAPTILLRGSDLSHSIHSFGHYVDNDKTIEVEINNRHVMDVLRTVAHELVHYRQHQTEQMPADAGATGSRWENEANAVAGVIMRHWQNKHPELLQAKPVGDNVVEASGYIPTRAQAKDPRFKTALTVDVRPGQTGKEANKLGLKVDSQGHPDLLIKGLRNALKESKDRLNAKTLTPKEIAYKHGVSEKQILAQLKKGIAVEKEHTTNAATAREIALDHLLEFPDYYDRLEQAEREEEQLNEVKMSPSALKSFAQSPEAKGIRIGFEAEIVFPGLGGDSEDGDYEPDYDEDTRTHSIDDIIDFFEYDDFGYGISGREADRLRQNLENEYFEYFDDALMSEWESDAYNQIRDYIERNDWDEEERILDHLEEQGLDSGQIEEIMRKAREATSTREQPEEYRKAAEAVSEELDARAEQSKDDQDEFYDSALEEFRDEFGGASEEDWLSENYRYMSDVADAFSITWPYVRYDGGDEDGYDEYNAQQLADDLERTLGVDAKASGGYHSTKRDATTWIFEPDSSLAADSGDMPVEIISPPMPLDEGLVKLREFFAWAKEHRAYTNDSTGFHMGVSLPIKGGNVDFLKLALFLGDEYVLQEFGREANTYTVAAMKKIREQVKRQPGELNNAMTLLRNGLIELANKSLSKIVGSEKNPGFGKYTSINPKGNYIEFRSAGGEDYSKDVDKLENTLLRYARAMTIAANPSAERKEYYKKLYKLIAPQGNNAALNLFAKYASGDISAEELKKEWAEQVLSTTTPKDNKRVTWKIYDAEKNKYLKGYQYSGYTEPEALALFKQAHSPGSSMEDFEQYMKHMQYELRDVSTNSGRWEIVNRATGEPIEIINATSSSDAGDLAQQKYSGKGIDYYIQPYNTKDVVEPVKPSRRAELAQRIKNPKAGETPEFTHYLRNKKTGRVEHLFRAETGPQAYKYANDYSLKHTGQYSNFESGKISALSPAELNQAAESMNVKTGNYYIANRDTDEVVHKFYADDNAEAVRVLNQWRETHPGDFVYGQTRFLDNEPAQTSQASQTPAGADVQWRVTNNQTGNSSIITAPSRLRANSMVIDLARRMGVDFENFTISPVDQQPAPQEGTPVERREGQVTTDAGIPMWEIYDRRSGEALTRFPDHNQTAAWSTAQQWLRDAYVPEENWDRFSVRPLTADQPAASSQPVAGSTQDRQQQRAQPGQFTGAWAVINANTGEEVHRFSGVGNVQADANRVAANWVRSARYDDPVEVVPIVG